MQSKINFGKIKEQLPFGAQTEIAKRANVSVSNVNRVLNGKANNPEILDIVADYLTEIKNKEQAINNRFAALIQ